ncbi:MAG: carboxypeptidase regulatory-like domain-containing protein [Candidatus Eisenbacteria bacterium]|nr:carboxypeptidase regulatory-like domain-containing protein [Candidatus Eisenbacteria bacterium]
MTHLTHDQLSAVLDHALKGRAAADAERHLLECATCRDALAALAAQETELRPALTHDPGDAYFERFAERVEDRIRAEAARGAARARAPWWSSPRALAWAGAAAALIGGAGLVLMTGREVRPPSLRDREIADRLGQEAKLPFATRSGARAKSAPAREDRLGAPAPTAAPAPVPAPADRKTRATGDRLAEPQREEQRQFITGNERVLARDQHAAQPNRANEIRTSTGGEPVPVGRRAGFANPPAATAPEAGAAAPEGATLDRVRKKVGPAPMQALKDEAAKQATSDAAPAPVAARNVTPAPVAAQNAAPAPVAAQNAPAAPSPPVTARREAAAALAGGEPAGEGRLCGAVLDAQGRPVAGAAVVIDDVARVATPDARGGFCVNAPPGEHPLSVMAVGFAEARQSVEVGAQESSLRVTLAAVPALESRGPTWGVVKSLYDGAPPRAGGAFSAGGPPDPYAAEPDSVQRDVRLARRLEATGTSRRSAAMFDAAAGRWAHALDVVAGGPLDLDARRHLADARFRAWEIAPNAARVAAAAEAISVYVAKAPAGADRDEAARRLERLRH